MEIKTIIRYLAPCACHIFVVLVCMICPVTSYSQQGSRPSSISENLPEIKVSGAMHDVMWKGELSSKIDLDTISDKAGLCGVAPTAFLNGEILIMDGMSFVSHVATDSTMTVEHTFNTGAPFLVYANVTHWVEQDMPEDVNSLKTLEGFLQHISADWHAPFVFKLSGLIQSADIHVQDLPPGTVVHSPEEAHRGQVSFPLKQCEVDVIGFFSTTHQGVFTHHDSYMHLHLITKDRKWMGHADHLNFDPRLLKLYLPVY